MLCSFSYRESSVQLSCSNVGLVLAMLDFFRSDQLFFFENIRPTASLGQIAKPNLNNLFFLSY